MSRERKRLILQLDKLAGDIMRKKHKRCIICGELGVEPHHFIHGRVNTKYRWDQRNISPVCRHHHTQIHSGIIKYDEIRGKALYWDVLSMEELEEIENDHSINKILTSDMKDMLLKNKEKYKKVKIST